MNFDINALIFSYLIIILFNDIFAISSNSTLQRYQVWIADDLPNGTNAFFLRCWSKDTNFGTHFLNHGEGFH